MPQFDFSTLSVVLFSSLISVAFYYIFFSLQLLPEVLIVLKFRTKKLISTNMPKISLTFFPTLFSYSISLIFPKKK